MRGIRNSILDTVGNTPVVRINNIAPAGVELYVKLEAFNPLGSVKDRLALGVIEAAERDGSLTPQRCLRALALMRLVNPRAEIRAAGGREGHLRTLNPLCLWPANSLFVEGYLTTRGDAITETYRMIRDAGFEVDGNPAYDREAFEGAGAGFRLAGAAPMLKPDVARETRGVGRQP